MWIFYLFALIPIAIGGAFWIFKHEVVWWEWLIGCAIALITSGAIHAAAFYGMTTDVETWSGQLTCVVHYPRWVEEYQQMHTRTVGSGKNARTETYFTTEHRTHPEHWTAYADLGTDSDSHDISRAFFDDVRGKFGGEITTTQPPKKGFDSGDRNIYTAHNHTRYVYPVTKLKTWENRVKAAPSVFSFVEVPDTVKVFKYPENGDWRRSDRLVGTAGTAIPIREWDKMCTRLGPIKKVNVILVGFGDRDSMVAHYQQAAWVGGRKNDLVLCYGGPANKIAWAYVFGWSESELAKERLKTVLKNSPIGVEIIPKIEKEIVDNYVIKDWSKFDYIAVEPPFWSYFVLLGVMVVTQSIFLLVAMFNNADKNSGKRGLFGRGRSSRG